MKQSVYKKLLKKYDNVGSITRAPAQHLFWVQKGGLYGVVTNKGRCVVAVKCTAIAIRRGRFVLRENKVTTRSIPK